MNLRYGSPTRALSLTDNIQAFSTFLSLHGCSRHPKSLYLVEQHLRARQPTSRQFCAVSFPCWCCGNARQSERSPSNLALPHDNDATHIKAAFAHGDGCVACHDGDSGTLSRVGRRGRSYFRHTATCLAIAMRWTVAENNCSWRALRLISESCPT